MKLTHRPLHGILYAPAENPFYVTHDMTLLSAGMVSGQACQGVRLYDLRTVYTETTYQIAEGRGFTQCFGLDELLCKGNGGIVASQNLILSAGGAWYIVGLVNIESGSGTDISITQYSISLSCAGSHEAVILQHQAIEPAWYNHPAPFSGYIGIIQRALEVYQVTVCRIGSGNANWCSRGTNLHTGRLMERGDVLVDYVTQCIGSTCHSAVYQIHIGLSRIHIIHMESEILLLVNMEFGRGTVDFIHSNRGPLCVILYCHIANLINLYGIAIVADIAFIVSVAEVAIYQSLVEMCEKSCFPDSRNKSRNSHYSVTPFLIVSQFLLISSRDIFRMSSILKCLPAFPSDPCDPAPPCDVLLTAHALSFSHALTPSEMETVLSPLLNPRVSSSLTTIAPVRAGRVAYCSGLTAFPLDRAPMSWERVAVAMRFCFSASASLVRASYLAVRSVIDFSSAFILLSMSAGVVFVCLSLSASADRVSACCFPASPFCRFRAFKISSLEILFSFASLRRVVNSFLREATASAPPSTPLSIS
nr:MAG TPA: hypothetical protein [Caudoviricetes sp.]